MARFKMRIDFATCISDLIDLMKFQHQFEEEDFQLMEDKIKVLRNDRRYAEREDAINTLNSISSNLSLRGPVKKTDIPAFAEKMRYTIMTNPPKIRPVITALTGQEIKISSEKMQLTLDLSKFNGENNCK